MTFSIDVDTASYSFMRASLNNGYLPDQDAVRPEELITTSPTTTHRPRAGTHRSLPTSP